MKVIELRAENFARLHAVEIRPDGHLVPISGKNGQGKTSILKAIYTAFCGKAAAPPRAIRDGAEEARLHVDVGGDKVELSIERTVTRGKHGQEDWSLKVTQAKGGRVTRSPQALIDASLDALAFDPLAFARAPPKEQLAQLKALVPSFDFDEAAGRREGLFDERTEVNREAKRHRAVALSITLPAGPMPEAVRSEDLTLELRKANEHNSNRRVAAGRVAAIRREEEQLRARASQLRKEAAEAEERAGGLVDDADRIEMTLPPEVVVQAIEARLASAQQVSGVRRQFAERKTAEATASAAEKRSTELTAALDALDGEVKAAIEAAKLPAGLSMTADGVLLNGRPFEQAGTAEKILASAEVRMALAPELRVMLIDEASELDEHSMMQLAELAGRLDYQIWCAKVSDKDGAGFVIEDGRVAAHKE